MAADNAVAFPTTGMAVADRHPPDSPDLSAEDTLELWKYFEDRAERTKQSMFATMTWLLGFAGALLAVDAKQLSALAELPARGAWSLSLAFVAAAAGLALCWYSHALAADFADHIERNWNRANAVRQRIPALDGIFGRSKAPSHDTADQNRPDPARPIVVMVRGFTAAFALLTAILAALAMR